MKFNMKYMKERMVVIKVFILLACLVAGLLFLSNQLVLETAVEEGVYSRVYLSWDKVFFGYNGGDAFFSLVGYGLLLLCFIFTIFSLIRSGRGKTAYALDILIACLLAIGLLLIGFMGFIYAAQSYNGCLADGIELEETCEALLDINYILAPGAVCACILGGAAFVILCVAAHFEHLIKKDNKKQIEENE